MRFLLYFYVLSKFTIMIIKQVFYDKMRDAQQEIKSTVTVNTSDMAAKAHEDKEQGKELEKLGKRKGGKLIV